MDEKQALAGFAAISQETRLRIIRLLVVAGADGMAAGAITEELGEAAASRVSFHLSHLEHAGLITSRREGALDYLQRHLPRPFRSCRVLDARLLPRALHDL